MYDYVLLPNDGALIYSSSPAYPVIEADVGEAIRLSEMFAAHPEGIHIL